MNPVKATVLQMVSAISVQTTPGTPVHLQPHLFRHVKPITSVLLPICYLHARAHVHMHTWMHTHAHTPRIFLSEIKEKYQLYCPSTLLQVQ